MKDKEDSSLKGSSPGSEEEVSLKGLWQEHHRQVLAGAAVLVLLLTAGTGLVLKSVLDRNEPQENVKPVSEIAFADARKVWPAHPDYERLQQLRAQALSLEMELEDLQELPLLTVQPPETDSQPFKDSVWQKNAQTVIGGRVQLDRERKAIEQDYRESTRAAYEAQRAALDDEYLNAILNINLKLDNQQQMHHPWTKQEELDEERAAWEQEALQLKQERGERQYQLKLAWDKQVQDYVDSVMAPKLAEWDKKSKEALEQQKAEAVAAEAAAQARNAELMSRQMALSLQVQQHLEKQRQLVQVKQELAALENHIANDIEGKGAKVAILHHYTMILSVPMPKLQGIFPGALGRDFSESFYGEVTGNLDDVTEELAAEVRTLESSSK
ncbi:hypothetical protein [Selenomonas sp. KH1T6]|uniref:hypothetical protein n=1 Tax=Selenomonas sp. KH1T6 TaxID=3158784 RepID=UPI0008A7FADC|nr:hypothetical protein SAMN05216583_10675 [Selenomonas ruminantium]